MKLVIVESPTKAKTISKFLGQDYIVKASMGHVMDLPKSKLGIDLDHDFMPQYELVKDRKSILSELTSLSQSADSIILATDPDREGEAIAAHIKDALSDSYNAKISKTKHAANTKDKNKKLKATVQNSDKHFSRIAFHEITKQAIEEALQNPRSIDENLVDAQTARRILDRLVGYKLSPILWQKVRRGLSAGRVQSVALRLIIEREREIEKFAKKKYWTIQAFLNQKTKTPNKNESAEFELIEINKEKIELSEIYKLYDGEYKVTKSSIITQEQADKIISELQTKEYIVEDILKKQTKRSPQPPYTTSTLQQDASRRLGLSGKRTMGLAQKLYEEGVITYHRTDSVHIAESAIVQMQSYIKNEYGAKYLPEKPRLFLSKQKNAQEAHEAIRPTRIVVQSKEIGEKIGQQYVKLYDLIWRRSLSSQMSDALIESTTVYVLTVTPKNTKSSTDSIYRFKTNGSILIFDGFLKVNPYGLLDKKLPNFQASEYLNFINAQPNEHETPPPPRYNDASIISSLEEEGIGRPSTYASIISTIEARRYIERQQGKFIPTSIGMAVNDFLVQHFSDIDDIPFTAKIENELDEIAKGEKKWIPMMKEFYSPLKKKLETVGNMERVKIEAEEVEEKCPKDGAPLVIRVGKYGKFLSCKNFPTCDFKKNYIQEANLPCPKDGDIANLPSNVQQPGRVIIKRTQKGRTFYGCSNYPVCTFAAWKLQDILQNKSEVKDTSPTVHI